MSNRSWSPLPRVKLCTYRVLSYYILCLLSTTCVCSLCRRNSVPKVFLLKYKLILTYSQGHEQHKWANYQENHYWVSECQEQALVGIRYKPEIIDVLFTSFCPFPLLHSTIDGGNWVIHSLASLTCCKISHRVRSVPTRYVLFAAWTSCILVGLGGLYFSNISSHLWPGQHFEWVPPRTNIIRCIWLGIQHKMDVYLEQ